MNSTTVKAYSLAKDGTTYLTKHFRVREFRCRDGSDPIFIADGLPEVLEQIRSYFGKAAVISSAYRTATHNKKEGGSTYSQHLYGAAADISISGVSPLEIAKYADELLGDSGGVGLYKTFVHVDVRKKKYRFDKRSGKEVAVNGF